MNIFVKFMLKSKFATVVLRWPFVDFGIIKCFSHEKKIKICERTKNKRRITFSRLLNVFEC